MMPDGEVTEPPPVTAVVSAKEGSAKEVPTDTLEVPIVTLQVPVPVQPLLQPANTYPIAGVAARFTVLFWVRSELVHVPLVAPAMLVQVIPPASLDTDPFPGPAPVTVTVD